MALTDVINFDRYPVDCLDSSAGRVLVDEVRHQLSSDGSCALEQFVTDNALVLLQHEAKSLVNLGWPGPTDVSPYFFNYRLGEQLDVDANHPVKRKGKRNLRQVAADLIPSDHLLYQLYHSPLLPTFLGQVLGQAVYANKDRYQSLNISVMEQGGCQQWHFDAGNMVTTLLLQAPDQGGVFEYAPNIRSEDEEHFDEVRRVLDGESDRVRRLQLKTGTLSLFRGHYSLHRVTEVGGNTMRLQAILGYTTNPDLVGNKQSSVLHYGPRVEELEAQGIAG